mmetsp:Transcript_203/g.308  ORF Transcript_203/g.308 Transcript_203/m.308 type:complete len:351 (+) Transcript_203:36-1088(+)
MNIEKHINKLGEISLKVPGVDTLSQWIENGLWRAADSLEYELVDEDTTEQIKEGFNEVRQRIKIDSKDLYTTMKKATKTDFDIVYDWALEMAAGAFCFFQGCLAAVNNDDLLDGNRKIIGIMLRQIGKIYLGLIILAVVLFPITAGLAFFSPGTFLSIGLMIPMWAFTMAQSESQGIFSNTFLSELNRIDPELAEELEETAKKEKRRSWFRSIKNKIRKSGRFTVYTLLINVLGYIPKVGWLLSFILQWVLTAETMGWNLLKPYFNQVMKKDMKAQTKFMDRHWFKIIGYTLPVVLVGFLPGAVLFTTYAQAGTAHLVKITHHQDHDNYQGEAEYHFDNDAAADEKIKKE